MTLMDIGGESFHVVVDGPADAPALMLSNSLSSNLSMWQPQMPTLSRHFRVVRYDSRGHGRSTAPAGPYAISQLGRDALNILDHLGIDTAHWCGLSKGGMVGMWLAAHAPERLRRIVLANTAARIGSADIWNTRIRNARGGGMHALLDQTMDRWFTKSFQAQHPETIVQVRRMVEATPLEGYIGCCAAIRDMDQRWSIADIRLPTLVIAGAHDPATTPQQGAFIAARIPGAKLLTLEAAHISNIEAADAFTSAVCDFLTA